MVASGDWTRERWHDNERPYRRWLRLDDMTAKELRDFYEIREYDDAEGEFVICDGSSSHRVYAGPLSSLEAAMAMARMLPPPAVLRREGI